MLGDKIWDGSGQTTGVRVLPGDDFRYVKMEVSIQGTGKALGMDATNIGTFTAFERVPGQMYAEGQGIIMTADGDSAIWNGHGVGHPTGDGMGISIRLPGGGGWQDGIPQRRARCRRIRVEGGWKLDRHQLGVEITSTSIRLTGLCHD
jgi:hypothetical protein